jgi:hypothetical protein
MRRFPRLRRHFFVAAIITLSAFTVALSLVPTLGAVAVTHTERTVRSHERLHFSLHLAAGRALSVCPCTRPLATNQYAKAAVHAPTPGERWLVTTGRPQRLLDGPRDLVTLVRYGGWIAVHSSEARGGLALAGIMMFATGLFWWRRLPHQDHGPIPP